MAKAVNVTKTTEKSAPAVDPAILDKAFEETRRMGKIDRVFHWDKRQAAQVWADADGKILTPEQLAADEQADMLAAIAGAQPGPRNRHHLVMAPSVIVCGNDKSHGKLIMHGSGSVLMCGAIKNGAACTYNQPVSV